MKQIMILLMLAAPYAWADETEGIDLADIVDPNHAAWKASYERPVPTTNYGISLCQAYPSYGATPGCDSVPTNVPGVGVRNVYTWSNLGTFLYSNHDFKCTLYGTQPDCDERDAFNTARATWEYDNHPTIICIRDYASTGSDFERNHKKGLCIDLYGPEPVEP